MTKRALSMVGIGGSFQVSTSLLARDNQCFDNIRVDISRIPRKSFDAETQEIRRKI
jgi:hypothetical protein